jgi:SAM-dependent methyltransferase
VAILRFGARAVNEKPGMVAGMPSVRSAVPLRLRYTAADLGVLTDEEARRFGAGDPQTDVALAWELLYRLEPELYDRLSTAERLHPAVLDWLPDGVDRIVEVGAGTGRLTLELVGRAREVVAIEPAAPMREILARKLAQADTAGRVRVRHGFFDELPVGDGSADLVVACSAFTAQAAHGGDPGIAEMERVCRPGGTVAIVWPNNPGWLVEHGYEYVSFPGAVAVEFAGCDEADELTEIFYPRAAPRCGGTRVPYEDLGLNPPRDLAFKAMPG